MTDNVVIFPKINTRQSEILAEAEPELSKVANALTSTHHVEVFAFSDNSYVILVQPKDEEFTVDRMVFMAERLKLEVFECLFEEDDELE